MSIGDEKQGIENGLSVLENLFESIVGAVYLDTNKNLNKTSKVILPILDIEKELQEYDGVIVISYKNLVQEWGDKYGCSKPRKIQRRYFYRHADKSA